MIVCAGRNEVFDFATPIGVGLVESSICLTELVLTKKPDYLLFVGSAGSYGNHQIFDIVPSENAVNIELGFLENKCYTPLENKNVPRETSNIVNSSNYITTDAKSSKDFLELGIELENMEFFALLSVAKTYNIPVSGIFVVTNYCDENAHTDFMKNHSKAKEILIKHMKEYNGKN